ncbi:MAG: F0F1 ATP synthase subunit epsilon [Armatimonadota bacterium]
MPAFALKIMAPDHAVFEGQAQSLIAPGVDGYLGILARHAPMVAELGPGVLTVTEADGRRSYFAVSSGFLEVQSEGVTILSDAAEAAADIDVDRARAAEERARHRLQERAPELDVARAEAALRRALARVQVAERNASTR